MAGYYTSKNKELAFKKSFVARSSAFASSPVYHTYSELDTDTVTSFRTSGRPEQLNTKFGRRDPYEVFYAYGAWRFDSGHPFQVDHRTSVLTHPNFWAQGQMTDGRYITIKGPLVPEYGAFGPEPLPIAPIASEYWGSRLISSAIPTNPVANVAQSIAELLREGVTLPGASFIHALRSRTGFLRSVGSEYLNVEFGWAPMVRDMENVFKAILQSRLILENLAKNSGLDVRRRRVLDKVVVSNNYGVVSTNKSWRPPTAGSTSVTNALFIGYPPGPLKNSGPLERTDLVTEQYSFSGAFSYYFENGSDPIEKLKGYEQRINALLGVRVLTPEVLWELAPWSWLADYFANFGHLATNVTRFSNDGLIMKYGYLMRHSVSKRIYTQNGVAFRSGGPGPFAITLQLERKERVRGMPFGFGLNPNSFTTRQWAILAALGLTKAPKTLP